MTRRFAPSLAAVIAGAGMLTALLFAGAPSAKGDSDVGAQIKSDVNYLDPPRGQFSDEWMILQMFGEKVGYAHSTMSRDGDLITTRTLTFMKIGRADQAVEISILQSTGETLEGRCQTFDSVTKMGMIEMRTRGTVEGGKAHLSTKQFGVESQQTVDFPKDARMAWGLFRAQVEHGLKPGTKYEVDAYEPALSTDTALRCKVSVEERSEVEALGKKHQAVKVTTIMVTPKGEIPSVGYLDDRGMPLRLDVVLAGLSISTLAADKETALADFEPPELFTNTLVKVGQSIDREKTQSITYTLRIGEEGRKLPKLPDTTMQKVLSQTERTATLRVARLDRVPLQELTGRAGGAELEEYLSASPTLNVNDEALQKMAAEAAGDESRPYALADKLRRYVTDEVKDKNLNVGFASASEVCRRKEGDCSEHGVLLAALGRARGLPSRVVLGLAYVPSFAGTQDVFGFHMWTQFHIGGQWVDFDAALKESDCSPARIVIATSSLKDTGLGDLAFAILDIVTGLEIKIDSIETR